MRSCLGILLIIALGMVASCIVSCKPAEPTPDCTPDSCPIEEGSVAYSMHDFL